MMHPYEFEVVYEIDETIYAHYMLNLTLQPIVENAIEHGLSHKENGQGILIIKGHTDNAGIKFIIQDNGSGMGKDKIDTVLSHGYLGYGLRNVDERIRLTFGETYGISLTSIRGTGTTVIIYLPQVDDDFFENS